MEPAADITRLRQRQQLLLEAVTDGQQQLSDEEEAASVRAKSSTPPLFHNSGYAHYSTIVVTSQIENYLDQEPLAQDPPITAIDTTPLPKKPRQPRSLCPPARFRQNMMSRL